MGLDLIHEVHGHADKDQQAGTTEVERHVELGDHEHGQQGNGRDVHRAAQGQTREYGVDVFLGAFAGTDAGDEAAVLLQVLGHILRVDDDGRVEVAEEEDQDNIEHIVQDAVRSKEVRDHPDVFIGGELAHRGREQQQRRGENGRDDARRIDAQGQVRVLAAKHLASDLALGVADGDTALGTLHEHDGRQHGGHEQHDDDREEDAHAAGLDEVHGLHDAARDAHHDTAEDDQGDAVADTAFSDLLTQPHDEHGTGREGGHGHHAEMPARIEEVKHAKEEGIEFMTLHNPIEYLADEKGAVKAVVLQKMQLGEPDASGRRSPEPIPGATETLDIDMAIVAVGVSPNPIVPTSIQGLELGRKNTIAVNEGMQTNIPCIFAGGDIVRGGATVILAMGDGRKAAASMHEYLQK